MTRTTRAGAVAGITALALLVAGCGDSRSSAGNTATSAGGGGSAGAGSGAFAVDAGSCPQEATKAIGDGEPIKIGMSMPLSGPLAVAGGASVAGSKAYIDKVNKAGGVGGHKIEIIAKDDGFDPGRATSNVKELTDKDQVFAMLSMINAPSIKATQPLVEASCTPQLFNITTDASFANPQEHPWTTLGIQPSAIEGQAIVDYIAKTKPGAKVALLKAADALSQEFDAQFPDQAKKAGLTMLDGAEIPAGATNIDSAISSIIASKPDVVFLTSLPNYVGPYLTGLARGGYKGMVFLNSSASAAGQWITPADPAGEGALVPLVRKDPGDPRWADDAAIKEFKADMQAAGQGKFAMLGNAVDGYAHAMALVASLEQAAKADGGLTRVNLMNAAWNVEVDRPIMLTPKGVLKAPADPYLDEAGEIASYSTKTKGWETKGTWDYEGKTGDLVAK